MRVSLYKFYGSFLRLLFNTLFKHPSPIGTYQKNKRWDDEDQKRTAGGIVAKGVTAAILGKIPYSSCMA